MIKDAIYSYFSNQNDITDLVSTRIYPGRPTQEATYPLIFYQRISGNRQRTQKGETGLVQTRYEFNCCGEDGTGYDDAWNVADALRKVSSGFRGTWGTTQIDSVILDDDSDTLADKAGGMDESIYCVPVDLIIWHREALPTLPR